MSVANTRCLAASPSCGVASTPRPCVAAMPARRGLRCRSVVTAATTVEKMGRDLWNNTYYPTKGDVANVTKPSYIINAEGQTLGRLATLAAKVIRGKHTPLYHPAMDMGCYVVVINADKVEVTGKKENQKTYFRHTQNKRSGAGRLGGWKVETLSNLRARLPERIVEEAVYGMLPKGRIGHDIRTHHLKVFKGAEHPHEAQQPTDITHLIDAKPSPRF